jgi:cyclic dehypoxanthinyl futalosine synthase
MGISREQALDCFRSDDLIGIGMEADAVRRRLHPEGVVTYAVQAVISSADEVANAEDLGAACVVLRSEGLSLETLERLVAKVKRRSPESWVQGLSAREVLALGSGAVERLRDAGLDSLGGVEPEVPNEDWVKVQHEAHAAGMRTTARIVFGAGEAFDERVTQFEAVRRLQEETGGFAALAPLSFHAVGGRELDEATAVEYLKTLAVARMFVDNIENLQAEWTTQGLKVLQMALRFGANDVGSVRAERPGVATEEELRRLIRDAGFRPAERDMLYRAMMVS